MSHTALSLSASPNPRLLEMRILTHHVGDERFAFLKGKWKNSWERLKNEARRDKDRPGEEKAMSALVGGYESSEEGDEGDDGEMRDGDKRPPPPPPDADLPPEPPEAPISENDSPSEGTKVHGPEQDVKDAVGNDEEKKSLRRQRAEEWKRKRAAQKEAEDTP